MARFFVEQLPPAGSAYTLTGENAAHAKVLRLRPGEAVTLCDGQGAECACAVLPEGNLQVGPARPCAAEPQSAVTLYLAFPKADKVEHVIQKATELGAAELVLFPSRNCVSRPEGKALEKKLERWQRIARSAAEQSGRGRIPGVRTVNALKDALAEASGAELPVLFYENEKQLGLGDALRQCGAMPHTVALMTGAEGGFTPEEIELAQTAGLRICTLGPRILRCETAPLAGLTAVMYAMGEI